MKGEQIYREKKHFTSEKVMKEKPTDSLSHRHLKMPFMSIGKR